MVCWLSNKAIAVEAEYLGEMNGSKGGSYTGSINYTVSLSEYDVLMF